MEEQWEINKHELLEILREIKGQSEEHPIIAKFLEVVQQCYKELEKLRAENHLLKEENSRLRDEINKQKGEKGRPEIKSSTLNKSHPDGEEKKERKLDNASKKKIRNNYLEIHETIDLKPEVIPEGAIFKGHRNYIVQGIRIKLHNTKYRIFRYQTTGGKSFSKELPKGINGHHFDVELRSFILSQSYQQHVPQKLILKQLCEFGVQISAGELNRIIIEGHNLFHEEKAEVLRAGLEVSSYINVDDTGARHKGKNGYCTQIGNTLFTWFESTESKSRINFLGMLRADSKYYVINEEGRQYMKHQKMPEVFLNFFKRGEIFLGQSVWEKHLKDLGIATFRHMTIATEGALFGSLFEHGFNTKLAIMSDDAGQFNIAGFLNALCWVHAERTIKKLIPFTDDSKIAVKKTLDEFWNLYRRLKDYKITPTEHEKTNLQLCFDNLFTTKTGYQSLDLALKRIFNNKKELLLVLSRPEIPLHNNLSENDIRDYVKRRKISATTRSDEGRKARDTFLSLKKTCQKLGISFWQYLKDRLNGLNEILPLSELIRKTATQFP